MSRSRCVQVMILASTLVTACGGGGGGGGSPNVSIPPPSGLTYTATSGVAQKGPLVKGSTVTAQELDSSLATTGKQYSYQVSSDLGTFAPTTAFGSRYIGVTATGNYFDEVANATSTGTVTLTAFSDLSTDSVLNVNLLTTLEYPRIQALVKSGKTFAAARTQAESEVLAAFNIHNAGSYAPFDTLDISKGTDGDKILTTISSLFTYGNTAQNLSALITGFQNDIAANGTLTTPATIATLAASAKALNAAAVAANLSAKYSSAGVTFAATDISNWLDQSGDGVVGKFRFQVTGASASSSFTFPSAVTDPYAGSSISVSIGQLIINGSAATQPATIKAGDTVSVSPPAGAFPNGVLTSYLLSGTNKIAEVSFVSGLASIAVTPVSFATGVGIARRMTATGTYSDGTTANLNTTATWTTSSASIATVTAGSVSGVAVGSTTVTATVGAVSASASLAVTTHTFNPAAIPTTSGSTVTLLTNGSVLVMASSPGTGAPAPVQKYDPLEDQWTSVGTMADARAAFTATLLQNGKVLVAGGEVGANATFTPSAWLYDPVANQWSSAGSLIMARREHTATLLPNGKVLIAGGLAATFEATIDAELYDPTTNTWSVTPGMVVPRSAHSATLLTNGKVLVAGGQNTTGTNLATAEIYDPAANTWTAAGSLASSHSFHNATLLSNGKVLVSCGYDPTTPLATEVYDPTANTWSVTGNMSTERQSATATLLPNGTVLVAGGSPDNQAGLSSAEVYDPAAGTWSATGSMVQPLFGHVAILLPNGAVLVTGTLQYPSTVRGQDAELYW